MKLKKKIPFCAVISLCYPITLGRVCYTFRGNLWGKSLEGARSTGGEQLAEHPVAAGIQNEKRAGESQPTCQESLEIWVQILISQNMERGSNLCYLCIKGKLDSN